MSKPKVALYWCASCGGCEESVVDLAERILDVVAAVDIVFWPVAMDFKYSDLEALADGELAVALINGAVRLDEQAQVAKLLRRKAQLVVAHGACACHGGVVGLGQFAGRQALLDRAYHDVPSLAPEGRGIPQAETRINGFHVELPTLLDQVRPLDQVIAVDYYLPGCPPPADLVFAAVQAVLTGNLPTKGSVIADSRALCDSCSRRDTKPEKLGIKTLKRVHQVILDPELCFLAQGVSCLGPATRGGCAERCLKGNMPCTGCFGPTDHVLEQGAKAASMIASVVDARDPAAVQAFVDSMPDPGGLYNRYTLVSSVMNRDLAGRVAT